MQWDTSDHDWLEGRGEPVHHLVRMIDDATSRSWGRFVPRDGTRENMGVLWEYVTRFGRAVDYYTDRDSMFTVAPRPGESKEQQRIADRLTQMAGRCASWGSAGLRRILRKRKDAWSGVF